MCLTIPGTRNLVTYKNRTKLQVAKKDINVFKVLTTAYRSPFAKSNMATPIHYKKGQTYEVGEIEIRKETDGSRMWAEVHNGLHSCTTQKGANIISGYADVNTITVEMIIPKGAKYIQGNKGQIVSNKLTYVSHGSTSND